jgi:hypothetical protein
MIRFRPKVVKIKWVYKLLYSIFIKQGFLFKALIPTGFDLLLKILPQKYQVRQKHTMVWANTLKKNSNRAHRRISACLSHFYLSEAFFPDLPGHRKTGQCPYFLILL